MSKTFRLKELREKRGKVKAEIEAIGTKLRNEKRAMTADEQAAFAQLKADWGTLTSQITAVESDISAIDQLLSSDGEPADGGDGGDPSAGGGQNSAGRGNVNHRGDRLSDGAQLARSREDIRLARQAWCRRQVGLPISREHVEACKRTGIKPTAKELVIRLGNPATRAERFQKRALTVTTSGGGYMIAQDYSYEFESKLVAFANVRGVAREVQTDNGAPMPWPTEDDTGNTGELLAINTTTATNADPSFSSVTFGAYKFSSKGILVPTEFIQDSAFDADSLVFGEAGTRIGRVQSTYLTTGTGTSQPKGVVTCASAGITAGTAAAITADEMTKLAHSVDPAYRLSGSCGYMMHDSILAYLLLLKDSQGRPLLRDSYAQGAGLSQSGDAIKSRLMLNDYPVFVNQAMTGTTGGVPTTGSVHVLFGDFSKFIIRDAGAVRLRRLEERYADADQVGFIAFMRTDSNCVNSSAIVKLTQP